MAIYERVPTTSTTTNTNTQVTTFNTGREPGNTGDITMTLNITRTSGAAAGTATPQYSIDGVSYATIPGQSAFTLTDVASQTAAWTFADRKGLYYQITLSTTGTGVLNSYAYFLEDTDEK